MSFFGTLASGVEDSAREKGYKLLMSNSLYKTESELDAINSLRNHDCQGIILHSEYSDEETLIKLAKDVPGLVLINRYIPSLANRCVWLDNESGAKRPLNIYLHTDIVNSQWLPVSTRIGILARG